MNKLMLLCSLLCSLSAYCMDEHIVHKIDSTDAASINEWLTINSSEINVTHWQDKDGRTLLYLAAAKGDPALIDVILAKVGPSEKTMFVNKPNNIGGNTPLHAACTWGHNIVASKLLGAQADILKTNEFGDTPLHNACLSGREGVARILIAAGTPIDQPNKDGATPLSLAAHSKHQRIIEILIEHEADPNMIDATTIGRIKTRGYQAEVSQAINLALAARKRTVGTTLAYATHTRLGANSPFALLPQILFLDIAHLALPTNNSLLS